MQWQDTVTKTYEAIAIYPSRVISVQVRLQIKAPFRKINEMQIESNSGGQQVQRKNVRFVKTFSVGTQV